MKELLVTLDTSAGAFLYEQIYASLRRDILEGRLSCGERLPSARLLASQLQVSRSTVDAAYAQLVSEGYLNARRGSGYYVCEAGELYDFTKGKDGSIADETVQLREEKKLEQLSVKYNFLPGQVDDGAFAYNAWRKCTKEALLELESSRSLLRAGHPQGEYALRRAIAAYLYQARGVRCEPKQLVIGAGNEYLLQLLGQLLDGPRKVVMESPTYLQAYHTFCNIGYAVCAVSMDEEGMRTEELPAEGVSLVYVMPSHQFPLGAVMPLRRRIMLLKWAAAGAGRYIIEDDHDSEFRYKGRPIPSLQGMAKQEHVIYLGTFSNSIMPSVRMSYMVLPHPLLKAYEARCGFYASTVSRLAQMTVCRFLEQGYFERHLNKMRGVYRARHDTLLQLLKDKPWVYRIYGSYAGLHLAVELACPLTEDALAVRARAFGIAVQGMSGCYIAGKKKPDERPVLLLGFGNLTQAQLQEGVQVLEDAVKST
ncbi:MAG: PLP-dependent aminotransferase family protein [Eubacterium sp.]|nr:PLP-dependent aminotransferase family protein [Eubacterium sp.]